MKLATWMMAILASGASTLAHAKAPTCRAATPNKPPSCSCDAGYTAVCVANTPAPTATPAPTKTPTTAPAPTRTPQPARTATAAPTAPPSGGLTLETTGDPSNGQWAIEARTLATGVYATFFIDGARTDEWSRPFCSFGDDGATCTLGSKGPGSHQVDVEIRDGSNNALVDKQSKTVLEGGAGPIPTTAPPTPLPTRTVPPAGPTPTAAPVPTAPAGAPTPPELPRSQPNVQLPTGGTVRSVPAGGNLQATLDAAQPGDIVELAAGATFNGNFVLRKKAAGPQVWLRSSAWQQLPPQGTRVGPGNASKMAKIVGQSSAPALVWDFGASHWYVTGLELTNNNAGTSYTNYGIAVIGQDSNGTSAPTQADLPDDVVFDRVYIHGQASGNTRRGVAANGGSFALLDSYVADIHEVGADNQAVGGWTTGGAVLIRNNYLNSCGETIMFGGADTKIANLIPSDITVEDNLIEWNPSWKGGPWSCKNLTELKNARRVLIRRNRYRNWWPAGQSWAFAWTVRNQNGTNPWAEVNDITFRDNVIENIENGANTLAHDSPGSGGGVSTRMARFAEVNNLWVLSAGTSRQFLAGAQDTLVEHNTFIMPVGSGLMMLSGSPAGAPSTTEQMVRFVYRNNIAYRGRYAVFGDNDGNGSTALNLYAPGAVFTANAMYDGSPATGVGPGNYGSHPGNFFPADIGAVGFVNAAGGDYRLSASSPYKGKATDGKDVGVTDWAALPTGAVAGPPMPLAQPVPRRIIGKPEEVR